MPSALWEPLNWEDPESTRPLFSLGSELCVAPYRCVAGVNECLWGWRCEDCTQLQCFIKLRIMSSNTENNALFKCPYKNHVSTSCCCNLRHSQLKVSVKKGMLLFWIYKGSFFFVQSPRIPCKHYLVKAHRILVKQSRKTFISFYTVFGWSTGGD